MIEYKIKENILESDVDAIVNPINYKGVMGAGLAKAFKEKYLERFKDYKTKYEQNLIEIRVLNMYRTDGELIVNFPTEIVWRRKSRLEWIEEGLHHFKENYKSWGIKSIALSQLGFGKGGLNWEDVKPLMKKNIDKLDIQVVIYVN